MNFEADISEVNDKFESEIENATFYTNDKCMPKSWWNKDLDVFYRRLNAATKAVFTHPSPSNFEELLDAKKIWIKESHLAKRRSYK